MHYTGLPLVTEMVKNPPAMRETWVLSLGWGDPLEKGMATHSSILAWRIPMDRGAGWATVHGVSRSRTQLRDSARMQYVVLVLRLETCNNTREIFSHF